MRRVAVALFIFTLVVAIVVAIAAALWLTPTRPGPVLYVGLPILTMNAGKDVVGALATEGDRIVAVGNAAQLRDWAEEVSARIVDLDGRAIVPGFIDAHGHFPGAGIYSVRANLNSPPISSVETMDDLVAELTAQAAKTSVGDWVVGLGYDDTLIEEFRHPTRHDLDRVSREHPVMAFHVSGHLAVINSLGLAELGIGKDTPDPEGGIIRRDPESGEPSGVLEEMAMMELAARITPSMIDGMTIMRDAGEIYVSEGVTTAQSGLTPMNLISGFPTLARLRLFPLRLVIWADAEAADAMLEGRFEFSSWDPLRVRLGAVKLIADGSIQGYTGYLREPYALPPGDDPAYRGYPRIPRDELFEAVRRFHKGGMQIAVHGNGDASIDDILDAFEAAQAETPRHDTRHIIIHAQMAQEDQLDRMKALGVIPSFFSLHTYYWGERHRRIFMGEARARRISPAASAIAKDLLFTIHADSPVVPMEPLRLVWSAVNRRTRTGAVLGEDQRISVMQALRAVTIDAAYQHFEESEKGSLEPGKLADFVILSRSPLDDPESIDSIDVMQTVIGGHVVYQAN